MASIRKNGNSISELLEEFLKLHYDGLNMLRALTEATTSEKDKVVFTSTKNGTQISNTIPSYNSLLKKINELVVNVSQLNKVKNRELNGPVFGIESISEPKNILDLEGPEMFYSKPNWFMENLLNPLLFIKLDVTSYVHPQSKHVESKRISPKLDTSDKVTFFKTTFDGKNDLDLKTVKTSLTNEGIEYDEIDNLHLLPALILRNSGSFSVVSISNDIIENATYSLVKKYSFASIGYTDNTEGSSLPRVLQVNDILITPDGKTQYTVLAVNQSTNEVTMGLSYGFSVVKVGTDVLKIASDLRGAKEVEIPISYEEATIIFLKGIDPFYHTTTYNWGEGLAFLSSDLKTIDSTGEEVTLTEFYSNVEDLGVILSGMITDQSIPASYGVKPETPSLDTDAFKVVKINSHLSNSEQGSQLVSLITQKEKYEAQIKAYDDIISRTPDNTAKQPYITLKNNVLSEYLIPVNKEILALKGTFSDPNYNVLPKYNIRGFVNLPDAPTHIKTGKQEIVRLLYSYRYLDLNENPPTVTRHTYRTAAGDLVNAMYSEWIEVYGPLRKKVKNTTTEEYEWEAIDNSNPNEININQIGIPISRSEKIELKVKLITEAGYPVNPMMSDWSDPIVIDFDENLYIKDIQLESALENLKYYSLQIEMNQCCEENTLALSGLQIRLGAMEKTLVAYGLTMDSLWWETHTAPTVPTACELVMIETCPPTPVVPTVPTASYTGDAQGCITTLDSLYNNYDALSYLGYILMPSIDNPRVLQLVPNPMPEGTIPPSCIDLPGVPPCDTPATLDSGYLAIGCSAPCPTTATGPTGGIWVLMPNTSDYNDAIELLSVWGCTTIYGSGPTGGEPVFEHPSIPV